MKMANEWINIYMNNPTAGGTDGTAISTDGTYTAPLKVQLDASQNETKTVKLAIRTETGYKTSSDTTICDVNDTSDRWKLSLTENGTFEDTITIANSIDTGNTIFWARASSSSLEAPTNDRTVSLRVSTVIEAV